MTSLKQHLVKMTLSSLDYEKKKLLESMQGSNTTVQKQQQVRARRLAEAGLRLADWQPTISH